VRDELSEKVDAMVAGAVQAASRKVTLLALTIVLFVSIVGAFAIAEAFARAA